jgi:hypothetical protein
MSIKRQFEEIKSKSAQTGAQICNLEQNGIIVRFTPLDMSHGSITMFLVLVFGL